MTIKILGAPKTPYAAAREADVLHSDPSCAEAIAILYRESEELLAQDLIEWRCDRQACQAILNYLVDQRVYVIDDSGPWEVVKHDIDLEAQIIAASRQCDIRPRDHAILAEVQAVAQRIIDRVPGAERADLGIV